MLSGWQIELGSPTQLKRVHGGVAKTSYNPYSGAFNWPPLSESSVARLRCDRFEGF